ncbi:MAG: O-linked N-acetylglucosamine transferase family protein [Burkholderiales bacterium]
MALFQQSRYSEIESPARTMTERFPHHGFGWKALGATLKMQGRVAEALVPMRRAAELMPGDAEAQTNLADALREQGRHSEAEGYCRRVLAIKPDEAKAHVSLGNVLRDQGRLSEAEISFRRALQINPGLAREHNVLGAILYEQGRSSEAGISFRQALAIEPDLASAHSNFGVTLFDQERLTEAEACHRQALAINPEYADAYSNLGNALRGQGRLIESEACCRRALVIEPNHVTALNNLGNTLQVQGRTTEAEASYRRALQIKPDYVAAADNLLMAQQYVESHTQAESFAEHLAFARRFETPLKGSWPSHSNSREPGKQLKVGYLSPDFRKHPVAYFLEPVLSQHNRESVEVYCYYSHASSDEVTVRLKSLAEHWRDIASMRDAEAAELILSDGIDILVDLAGHTTGNKLLTFARKPAPVQATWLGYACTTGLSAMDYRITDAYADPVGASERYYSETLYRLPEVFACYQPPSGSPDVGQLPASGQGCITFGSFNNLIKLTQGVRALWAQVLLAVAGSRLMLKSVSLAEAGMRQQLLDDFARLGVGEERLILATGDDTHFAHLDRYNSVDIGLDPFPYNGTTTTFESLWMGVPVVTLAGNSFISRQGVSMLTNAGLTELVADTPAEYVAIAARLAGDLDRLSRMRAGMRDRMANSPLLAAKRFTLDLEKAYRQMWHTHVSKSDAASHR